MVRKWSYLENNFIPFDNVFNKIHPYFSFKVFRKTTRFKKFNLGFTKFLRKIYFKKKHRRNWINMSYITNSWSFFFLKNKQFIRYYQSIGCFFNKYYSTSIEVYNSKYQTVNENYGVNLYSCSKSIINYFLKNNFKKNYIITPLKRFKSTGLMSNNKVSLISNDLVNSINPGLLNFDNVFYNNETLEKIDNDLKFIYIIVFKFVQYIYIILTVLTVNMIFF